MPPRCRPAGRCHARLPPDEHFTNAISDWHGFCVVRTLATGVLWLPVADTLTYTVAGRPPLLVASTGLRTVLEVDALAGVLAMNVRTWPAVIANWSWWPRRLRQVSGGCP